MAALDQLQSLLGGEGGPIGPTRPGYNDPALLARLHQDLQRDLNLSPDQALGFLSNLNAESFGFTKPQEVGSTNQR